MNPCDKFCLKKTFIWPPPELWRIQEITKPILPFTSPHYCSRLELPQQVEDFQFKTRPVRFQEASIHHALGVMTSPRPRHATIQTLFNSLSAAGMDRWIGSKLLLADGCSPDVPPGWILRLMPGPSSGAAAGFKKLLQWGLDNDPLLEQLTFLEDDVILSKNALDYIARVAIPQDLSLITWFNYDYNLPDHPLKPPPTKYPHPILACRSTRMFINTQAVTINRRTIDSLLRCPYVQGWPNRGAHDEMFSWAIGDVPYAAHFPCLAQHENEKGAANSAFLFNRLNESPNTSARPEYFTCARTSPFFEGEEFDSLSLMDEKEPA